MRIFKSIVLVSLLVAMGLSYSFAQRRPTYTTPHRFALGEELHFEAEFSRALLRNIDVADLKFRATRTPLDGALTFTADVSSKGFFARLFNLKFRERVESTVEPITFTVQKTTILDEQGKRVRTTESTFDASKGRMVWTSRDPNNPSAEPRHAITEFSGQLQDVLSAIYFIRTQPLAVGKSFEVFVGDGGKVYTIPVKVVETKRMKTILGRVEVLRVNPELFGPGRLIEKEKGEFSIWITDDARHIPVSARVKTDYGTFEIRLKRIVNPDQDSPKEAHNE